MQEVWVYAIQALKNKQRNKNLFPYYRFFYPIYKKTN